jgi:hypothetical protein
VLAPEDSDSTIAPVKIEVKGTGKRISFKFPSPKYPCRIPFKLHIISDTYVGLGWEGHHVMEVKRKTPTVPKRRAVCNKDDEHFFGCSRNQIVDHLRYREGIRIGPAAIEKIILGFLRQQVGIGASQSESKRATELDANNEEKLGVRSLKQGNGVLS